MLDIAVRDEPDRAVVVPSGELDIATGKALELAIDGLLGTGLHQVVVDLSALDFMDASAAALLLACAERAQRRGVAFSLIVTDRPARRLLELCGLLGAFDVIIVDGDGTRQDQDGRRKP
jgi:anti-sigma B factor antagonist